LVFERIFVPLRLRAELADKERQEAVVTASDLDSTIVRPARLSNRPATGRLRAQARLPVSIRNSISRADVAQFVIRELEHGDHLLTAPTLTTDHQLAADPATNSPAGPGRRGDAAGA